MQLKIVSWNIRHFRKSKITDFIHTLWEVCAWADVVFIYEDHTGLGRVFADALNAYEVKHKKTPSHWKGDEIFRTDEYVAVVWRSPVAVSVNHGAAAGIASVMPGERAPAVVDVQHGKSGAVTVAAWHAYGPAKVSAKDLFQRMLRMNHCDVLIGDFNFQSFDKAHGPGGLEVADGDFDVDSMDFEVAPSFPNAVQAPVGKRSVRLEANQVMQEIVPCNHRGSTTYTDEAQGKRSTGLDRCLVKKQLVASVQLAVAQPAWFDELAALTDHMPLLLIVEIT